MSQEYRSKNIDKIRNYFLEEIDQNEFRSRKHNKVIPNLNFVEHFLILASAITGYISIFAIASFIDIPRGITSSAIELKVVQYLQELKI